MEFELELKREKNSCLSDTSVKSPDKTFPHFPASSYPKYADVCLFPGMVQRNQMSALCLKQDQMLGQMCSISSPFLCFLPGPPAVPELCSIRSLLVHGALTQGHSPSPAQLDKIMLIFMSRLLNWLILWLLHATGW